jgi:uncharacterized tellurite resistance protein B-like protein
METLEPKLKRLIEAGIPETEAHLETLPGGHVCGDIVSTRFRDLDYEQRRNLIRAVWEQALARGDLTPDEHLAISTLLTYTPEEWSVDLQEY